MIAHTHLPWDAADDQSSMPPADLSYPPNARQALDQVLAVQMQLELATGIPVAIYGPTGQFLPGISPIKPRQAAQKMPLAQDVLAPEQWPRDIGQMLEVVSNDHLRFFITPFVLSNTLIAQVVLGPLQLFEPAAPAHRSHEAEPSRKLLFNTSIPVLAPWKAQAAAEIARTLVSKLSVPAADNPPHLASAEHVLVWSDQETVVMPIPGNTSPRQHTSETRLEMLAQDAALPEKTASGRLERVIESAHMAHTSSEDHNTMPAWPMPSRPSSPGAYQAEGYQGGAGWLRNLIEAMPQAVIISALPDGQVVLANRAARKLWPRLLTAQTAGGNSSAPLRYETRLEDYPPEWLGLRIVLRQAESFRGEVSVEEAASEASLSPRGQQPAEPPSPRSGSGGTPGPKQRPLLLNAFPLSIAPGVPSHAVAIFEDLSGLMERELFKDELLQVAAHDVRNPLTLINSHAQLLQRNLAMELPPGQGLERARGRLDEIQEQVNLLTQMTDQLYTVIRLQSAQQRPFTETVNLARLVQRAAIDQQMLTPGRTIETVIERNSCLVQGDQKQIELICMHLLKNAAKYSLPDRPISVSLRCTPTDTPLWAEVSVRDQGIGIPHASLPHIFERFYRVLGNEQRARVAGIRQPASQSVNLGLSLYLCKQLMAQMGGRIWLESVEGQGTTVSFALPLKQ